MAINVVDTSHEGIIGLTDTAKALLSSDFYNSDYFIDCSTVSGRLKAYKKCDVVRTVIGKSSAAIANLKVWALDENGKQVITPQARRIIAKLMRPNPKEDFKRFFKKLDAQCKLHGKAYVHKEYSRLFKEYNYYIIPFEYVTEQFALKTDSLYERVVDRYLVNDGTNSYSYTNDEVHVFYDISLAPDKDGHMFGGSRFQSLSEVISTYVVIWEALTEMYANRGALNLISMGVKDAGMMALSSLKSEKESLLKRLSERFGLRRGQSKNVVLSTDAKVNSLTAKMSEMQFTEIIIECKKAIGSAFDIPAPLLDIESSRYKNMTEAIKNLYTNGAIPTAEYFFSEWLQMVGEISLPFELKADYSHLEFYQQGRKEEGIAFQQMASAISTLSNTLIENKPVISNSEARIKLDLE